MLQAATRPPGSTLRGGEDVLSGWAGFEAGVCGSGPGPCHSGFSGGAFTFPPPPIVVTNDHLWTKRITSKCFSMAAKKILETKIVLPELWSKGGSTPPFRGVEGTPPPPPEAFFPSWFPFTPPPTPDAGPDQEESPPGHGQTLVGLRGRGRGLRTLCFAGGRRIKEAE